MLTLSGLVRQIHASLPKGHSKARAGWFLKLNIMLRNHPVCAVSEGEHFLSGAATPPNLGGEYALIRYRNYEAQYLGGEFYLPEKPWEKGSRFVTPQGVWVPAATPARRPKRRSSSCRAASP